jgi:hypothetical protein
MVKNWRGGLFMRDVVKAIHSIRVADIDTSVKTDAGGEVDRFSSSGLLQSQQLLGAVPVHHQLHLSEPDRASDVGILLRRWMLPTQEIDKSPRK